MGHVVVWQKVASGQRFALFIPTVAYDGELLHQSAPFVFIRDLVGYVLKEVVKPCVCIHLFVVAQTGQRIFRRRGQ